MNRLNFLPTPPLPFTGSFESEPDGGWRKMKGAAKWMVFKGGKLYSRGVYQSCLAWLYNQPYFDFDFDLFAFSKEKKERLFQPHRAEIEHNWFIARPDCHGMIEKENMIYIENPGCCIKYIKEQYFMQQPGFLI
jgi:hypothetical protein